ncbi:MAG: dUTP diphosphatase [Propionibacteriaceae bacterium]|jgi:dUTP pyrophosphatase|nr:dUTP diphosphatase [Propionibacteriaceae bacterium]
MMDTLTVPIRLLDPRADLPSYAHPGDAGADLRSSEDVVLEPGERKVVGTGISLAVPPGYAAMVYPRSGLAAKSGVTVLNSPGLIDSGYRGEIRVCLINTDPTNPVRLVRGDRIAQLVIQRVEQVQFAVVAELSDSARGVGGYGSSGGVAAWQSLGPLNPDE